MIKNLQFFLVLLVAFLLVPSLTEAAVKLDEKTGIGCEVSATKKVVSRGESTILSWTAHGAILSYGPSGEKIPPFGSMTVSPTKRTIYKFKFVGIGGNEKCGIRIRVEGETVPK